MSWLALLLVASEHLRGRAGRAVLDRLGPVSLRLALLLAVLHAGLGLALPGHPVWARLPLVVAAHWILVLPMLWISVRFRSRWRWLAVLAGFPLLLLGMSAVRLPSVVAPEEVGFCDGEPFEVRGHGGATLRVLRFAHPEPTGVVVLVHGIGAEKSQFLPAVAPLRELGCEVWTYDQRGHGASGHAVCTFGRREADDLVAVWQHVLTATTGIASPRLVYGVSLGGAAAQTAAPRLQGLDGIVLDSTFAALRSVGARQIPWVGGAVYDLLAALRVDRLVLGERVLDGRPVVGLAACAAQVLVLHAQDDPVVPPEQAGRLAAGAGPRATLVRLPGRGHGTGFAHAPAEHRAALARFAAELGVRWAGRRRAARRRRAAQVISRSAMVPSPDLDDTVRP